MGIFFTDETVCMKLSTMGLDDICISADSLYTDFFPQCNAQRKLTAAHDWKKKFDKLWLVLKYLRKVSLSQSQSDSLKAVCLF